MRGKELAGVDTPGNIRDDTAKEPEMPAITNLNLTFDASADIGAVSFTINWSAEDGPVGRSWDMLLDFMGSDEGEALLGSNDVLAQFGFMTNVRSMPTDSRTIGFQARGGFDEDDPLFFLWPFAGDPLGIDEVFVEVALLPVPRSFGARGRSNTIRGLF